MVKYFGMNIREKSDGMKLTRENYIKVRNVSSFGSGKVYSEDFIEKHKEDSLYNYDLNMEYFCSLPKPEFNKELMRFVDTTKLFKEITDLAPLNKVSGYYIMVLDDYAQAYIGKSGNIKKRIQDHWSKQKEFDRLIFGGKEDSILSIDSFRAYDTTRIFVYLTEELEEHEDNLINCFDAKYLLNRTRGGLVGLAESMIKRKTRTLSV
ncbi:hypothetical protein MZM54_00650 [[Brevibacterium] frigoritolerans]|nr:hypothetical protein [Peribacillus frigoritolerans]